VIPPRQARVGQVALRIAHRRGQRPPFRFVEIAGGIARRVATIAMKDQVFRTPPPGAPGVIPLMG
jgi:hypothetical protein